MADPGIDKREVARAFGRAAPDYDAHAVLQREVMSRLAERLGLMNISPARILDLGCGTGHGMTMFRQSYSGADVIALDIARPMLEVARSRGPSKTWLEKLFTQLMRKPSADAHYLCADIERLPLRKSSVDLIWSNLALQWVGKTEEAFRELHRAIAPNGLLVFSTFGPDTLKELRHAFSQVDGGSHVSRFVDMHDIGDMLVHAGFQHPVMEMEMITLTYSDLKSLMRDLKGIGAHNAATDRPRGMMGKESWQKLEHAYDMFRIEDRLPASFEVVYGHAWAGDKLRLEDGRQVIQFNIQKRQARLGR